MKKLVAYALPAILGLIVVEVGLDHQATAAPAPQQILTPAKNAADLDLVGVVGDVLVDGCKPAEAACSKAWQELGQLAGKDGL
jgi:hypothetical protein